MAQEMSQREILVAIRDDAEFGLGLRVWIERRHALRADGADELDAIDEESLIRLFRDARARIAAQDARQDSIEELIRQTIEQTAAIRGDTAAMRVRMDEFSARMDAFSARMEESDRRFAAFEARMDESDRKFAEFQARMDEHAEYMRRVDRNQQRLGARIGNMRGSDLEGELLKGCDRIMGDIFDCVESDVMWSARGGPAGMVGYLGRLLDARMRSARRRGQITTEQYKSLRSADLIARGRFDGGKPPVWVAVEASASIDMMDIDRAWDRAVILGALENVKAEGMVYGYSIPASMREYAQECGVSVIIADEP